MNYSIPSILLFTVLCGCGGGGGSSIDPNIPASTPTPSQTCRDAPSSLNQAACSGAAMDLGIITTKSSTNISQTTTELVLDDLSLVRTGLFTGYEFVAGLKGNANEAIAYVPMTGTLTEKALTFEGSAYVETVNPNNNANAFSMNMQATIDIDLTQSTPEMDVLLFDATEHSALVGNSEIPKTGTERVRINNFTVDPKTGLFSTTLNSTITKRNFIVDQQTKTYSNPLISGGLAGTNANELAMIVGDENTGYITMQVVGKKQDQ